MSFIACALFICDLSRFLPAIIYSFENYASKELLSFSQIAQSATEVIEDSSDDKSIIEDDGITHYEKYNSEEGKQIIFDLKQNLFKKKCFSKDWEY